jgi:CRISPR/Cas system CMR-associated protein Cmr1 (group 7 of RAMP superfamily)
MNPHYPDYYSGKTPPADWQLPIPLKFLTVERNTEFIFPFKTEENILEDEVKILIKEALSEVGIGAKTSVGYGYFKDLQYVPVQEDQLGGVDSKIAQSPLQTTKLPGYLKNPNELNDDFLNPDGSFKTEEQYKNFLVSKKAKFSKKRKQQYEKAKNWYEKQQDKK